MPNLCSYAMRIQGKEEQVDEFVKIIQAEYHYDSNGKCNVDRHLWRVFDAYLDDEDIENGIKTTTLSGSCAWSVYSCMCEGAHTYQSEHPDGNGTTLQIESERLELAIEVFSEECGNAFMEHFAFVKGKCLINECVEWNEYACFDYENVDDMNAQWGTNFTQEQFEENDFLSTGGMEWVFSDWTEELETIN